jgi:hypothetical protein
MVHHWRLTISSAPLQMVEDMIYSILSLLSLCLMSCVLFLRLTVPRNILYYKISPIVVSEDHLSIQPCLRQAIFP